MNDEPIYRKFKVGKLTFIIEGVSVLFLLSAVVYTITQSSFIWVFFLLIALRNLESILRHYQTNLTVDFADYYKDLLDSKSFEPVTYFIDINNDATENPNIETIKVIYGTKYEDILKPNENLIINWHYPSRRAYVEEFYTFNMFQISKDAKGVVEYKRIDEIQNSLKY